MTLDYKTHSSARKGKPTQQTVKSVSRPTPDRAIGATFQATRRGWFVRGCWLLAVLLLTFSAWLGWRYFEIRRAGHAAIRLAQRGRLLDAEPMLRRALQLDPDNVDFLRPLALGLLEAQNLEEAESVLTRWCQMRPVNTEPFRLRMDLLHYRSQQLKPGVEQQRLKELALADGLTAIEHDPNDATTAQKVVWLCLASGRFEEADRICRGQIERRPNDPELLYLQARVCHASGCVEEAQMLLEKLLTLRAEFAPGLLLRAILHYESGDAEQAIPLLRKVIAEDGASHKEARYHLSLALARAGHAEEARREMAEVQRINFEKDTALPGEPDSQAVRVRRAELLFASGRAQEALASIQSVLADDPSFSSAHLVLATYYEQRGESSLASEHRRRAIREVVAE